MVYFTYAVAAYALCAAFLLCIPASRESWLHHSRGEELYFRRPTPTRVGCAMYSLLFLISPIIIASATSRHDLPFIWFLCGPLCVGLFLLFVYMAGPSDVCINRKSRTCYSIKGWLFCSQRQAYYLTDSSSLCVLSGSEGSYVLLRVGDSKNHKFTLAATDRMSKALTFAQRMSSELDLPIGPIPR